MAETHRQLALITQVNIDHNEVNLARLRKWLDQALWLFLAALMVWVLLAVKVSSCEQR